ncbi:MAG: hypothetical protein LBJ63_06620 [Prevotellaceae bacterium]|jgi:hypothetical protein|nr:hypothetical protein [Prevotellaceae bacterium]
MKKSIIIIIAAFMVAACSTGNVSKSGGVDNMGYLQFVQSGNTVYSEGVTVMIDDNPSFTAKVDKLKKMKIKANTYAIKTGTRHLKVIYQDKILYEKNIIVAIHETKQINLP